MNCSSLSGPWGKVKGISLQAGLPPHSGLSWSESCRCPSPSRWFDYSTTVSSRKLRGTIYINASPGETFPVPYLDSSVPYLDNSTIACKGGKRERHSAHARCMVAFANRNGDYPLISSGEMQSYSFNLIYNFEGVPTSHCFQWEINKCLSILSE